MTTKTVYIIIQRSGYDAPGVEEGWDLVRDREDVSAWQDVHQGDSEDLYLTVTGASHWQADGQAEHLAVEVDPLTWARVRMLEAARASEYERHAEAARILREVREELDAYVREPLGAAIRALWEAMDGNYTRTAAALGISDVAVRKWIQEGS